MTTALASLTVTHRQYGRLFAGELALAGAGLLALETTVLLAMTEWSEVQYPVSFLIAVQLVALGRHSFLVESGSGNLRGDLLQGNLEGLLRIGPLVFLTEVAGWHYAMAAGATFLLVLIGGLMGPKVTRHSSHRQTVLPGPPAPDDLQRNENKRLETRRLFRPLRLKRRIWRLWWRWRSRAALVVVTVTAVFLRVWKLDDLGLNSDEAVYTGQAANLAGLEPYDEHFSVFRAHPLLFQLAVSLVLRFQFWDTAGRWMSTAFGLGTVWLTYLIGRRLLTRRGAALAAVFLAVMPYHVVVSRQALLEAPNTFFVTLSMYALLRYATSRTYLAALGLGMACGLAFLSKETAVMMLLVVGAFLALRPGWRTTRAAAAMIAFIFTISPHAFAMVAGRGAEEGGASWANYLLWQLSRPPNHRDLFYLANMPHYFGLLMLVLVVTGGVWLVTREGQRTDRSVLLLAWVGIPFLLFQLWPVKGYHYLLPIAPAAALVAAVGVEALRRLLRPHLGTSTLASTRWATVVVVGSAIWVTAINGPVWLNHARVGDAGYSGLPNVREFGEWVETETPVGARFLGIGPSISNIILFYADRETLALSVSPNPVRTNPAYEAVRNADYDVRWGLYDYLVYDAYSATRSSHFGNRLLDLAERYGRRVVYQTTGVFAGDDGGRFEAPAIRVYRIDRLGATTRLIEVEEE